MNELISNDNYVNSFMIFHWKPKHWPKKINDGTRFL